MPAAARSVANRGWQIFGLALLFRVQMYVTGGFYRFCRNPIFLFMLVALLGFALLLPTPISFVLVVGALLGIRRQVLEEEAYLSRAYGASYQDYARRVGRFLPWVGRLG